MCLLGCVPLLGGAIMLLIEVAQQTRRKQKKPP
jgi:hypothetical protein